MVVPTNKTMLTTAKGCVAAANMHTLLQADPITFETGWLISHGLIPFRRACFSMEEASSPR